MNRVLIANRGEIAVRIIRTCRKMGYETVAVYSEADAGSLHCRMADYAACIGAAELHSSYLNIDAIIAVAVAYDVWAIHPGFGMLSENPDFRRACDKENIAYIGPQADVIELLGNKIHARSLLSRSGIPVIPGSDGPVREPGAGRELADGIGYPVLIKAAAGGGGCGMRVVRSGEEFTRTFRMIGKEALQAFGDAEVFVEKYLEKVRHVEVQIMADHFGRRVPLCTRDCSLQIRNKKVMEEGPAVCVSEALSRDIQKTALEIVDILGYTNAGTVEFLVDGQGRYYFIEMNTRLQVEHPVTEAITGVDIVEAQIRVAENERILLDEGDVEPQGHAMECRINAQDPDNRFLPSTGVITALTLPSGIGVRVDSGVTVGSRVPSFYDGMLLKIITHAQNREMCARVMRMALDEFSIEGVKTNIDFCRFLVRQEDFIRGDYHTKWVEDFAHPAYLEEPRP